MSDLPGEVLELPRSIDVGAILHLENRLAAAESGAGPLVLRGPARDVFCAGMALDALAADVTEDSVERFARVLVQLRFLPRPTLAVVAGEALGGGLGLAAACDVVLAGARARFGLPECLFGLVPGAVLPFVEERAGAGAARRLAIVGDSVGAAEALHVGLADDVVDDDTLESAERRWVRRLGRARAESVRWVKRSSATHPPAALEQAALSGARSSARAASDPDVQARLRRFVEEGEAPWERT